MNHSEVTPKTNPALSRHGMDEPPAGCSGITPIGAFCTAASILILEAWALDVDAQLPWAAAVSLFTAAILHIAFSKVYLQPSRFWSWALILGIAELFHTFVGWIFLAALHLVADEPPITIIHVASELTRIGLLAIGIQYILPSLLKFQRRWPTSITFAFVGYLSHWLYVFITTRPDFMSFMLGVIKGYHAGDR